MYEIIDRLFHPNMEYYREVYKNSERWNSSTSLEGKKIIVYGEQGNGDIIQFARYLKCLKKCGCHITLHAPLSLERLLMPLVDAYLDKDEYILPEHDFHIPSMSLPFALKIIHVEVPYLNVPKQGQIDSWEGLRIGIAWEGNPMHSNSASRNCPLKYFKFLGSYGKIYSLQKTIHNEDLLLDTTDMDLYGSDFNDYADTANFLAHMDFVVSVDTSVLHLAGAMGKLTYGLLSDPCDGRWDVAWYPSVTLIRQESPGDWNSVFQDLKWMLDEKYRASISK